MLTYALIVFVVAAIGGAVLASRVLAGRLAPWALSLLHAALGAAGLLLLLAVVIGGGGSTTLYALIVLTVAALGGFYLAALHLRGTIAPKSAVIVHAGVAAMGVVLLLTNFV